MQPIESILYAFNITKNNSMANIKVNKEQWDAVSEADQQKIITGLMETGALKEDDQIIGVPDVAPITEDTVFEPMWNPIKDICKALCDSSAAVAIAWCIANTGGLALPACIAVAEGLRRECKDRC
ncbi:MAG: hypothetical protein V4584_15615 [Verrucomicrobiota bacterium]